MWSGGLESNQLVGYSICVPSPCAMPIPVFTDASLYWLHLPSAILPLRNRTVLSDCPENNHNNFLLSNLRIGSPIKYEESIYMAEAAATTAATGGKCGCGTLHPFRAPAP